MSMSNVVLSSPEIQDEDTRSSPTLSPVRLFVSPRQSNIQIPPIPSSEALSNSRILSEENDLHCHETFLDAPVRPKDESVEDTMDRFVLSVKTGAMMVSHLWDEMYLKLSRMKYERNALKRTIDHLENELEETRNELTSIQAVNKMMTRTIHRFKKQMMEKEQVNGTDEGCSICARTVDELMNHNLARISVACCANEMCLDCIVRTTHIQQTNQPVCPFCRHPLA